MNAVCVAIVYIVHVRSVTGQIAGARAAQQPPGVPKLRNAQARVVVHLSPSARFRGGSLPPRGIERNMPLELINFRLKAEATDVDFRGFRLQAEATEVGFRGFRLQAEATEVDSRGFRLQAEATEVGFRGFRLQAEEFMWRGCPWL